MKAKTIYNVTVEVTEVDGDGIVKHDKQEIAVEDDKGTVRRFLGEQFNRFAEREFLDKVGEREW